MSGTAPDLETLVPAAAGGDAGAFEQLFSTFGRLVYGVLTARLPSADVDDVAQDTFALAWRRLPTLRQPDRFGPWIAAIARRRAADHLRSTRRFSPLDETTGVDGHVEASAEAARVLDAIRHLPEAYSETLALRLVEGYSGAEIAALTGLTPGSVRVNLHRGLRMLREQLGDTT